VKNKNISHCLLKLGLAVILSSALGTVTNAAFGQTTSYIIDTKSGDVIKLGSLAENTFATAINEAGQAAGYFYTAGSPARAFVTGPDGVDIRALGTFGGSEGTVASGINNAGQVVGFSSTEMGNTHAFITGPNGTDMRDLGTLGGPSSHANSINDDGLVVGSSWMPWEEPWWHARHAFITGPNGIGMTDLRIPLGDTEESFASAINATGQAAGYVYTRESGRRAFIVDDERGLRILGVLDGTSPDTDTYGHDINAVGQVVGQSHTSKGTHAFITGPDGQDGVGMRDIGTLGGSESYAYGVNDIGQVAGSSLTTAGDSHAFVTGGNGEGMIDLNLLVDLPDGVTLTKAEGINNSGQVIATGIFIPPIPEPETYALMLVGLMVVGFMSRRKSLLV
jgi:probable HAF family extracellular repeat protein